MSERYEIIKPLGTGGFGTVYRAKDKELNREVAVKRLKINEDDDGAILRDQLLAEARTLATMRHPNIVSIFDIQSTEAGGEIVMELVHGVTLDVLVSRHLLLIRDFKFVAGQMLSAIAASHSHNILHCDLKPGNIMLCQLPNSKYEVKVLDFGMAPEAIKPPEERSGTGKLVGSIFFMAPEQFETGKVSPQTDVYALGCLFYFLLTGCYPFYGEVSVQVMAAHMTGKFTPISSIRPDLPEALCHWVEQHINHDPKKRYQTCKESQEALEKLDLVNTTEVFTLSSKKTLDSMGSRLVRPITMDSLKEGETSHSPSSSYKDLLTASSGGQTADQSNVVARSSKRAKTAPLSEEETIQPPKDAVWYFSVEEDRKGPVSLTRLKELCQQGKFHKNDLVWHPSFVEWVPAERCADLSEALQAAEGQEPQEPKKQSEKRRKNETVASKEHSKQKNKPHSKTSPAKQKHQSSIFTGELILTIVGTILAGLITIFLPDYWPIPWLILIVILFLYGLLGTRIRQLKTGILWLLLGVFLPVVGDIAFAASFGRRAIRGVFLMALATAGLIFLCIQMHLAGLPLTSIDYKKPVTSFWQIVHSPEPNTDEEPPL